jgi:hypothetical protein
MKRAAVNTATLCCHIWKPCSIQQPYVAEYGNFHILASIGIQEGDRSFRFRLVEDSTWLPKNLPGELQILPPGLQVQSGFTTHPLSNAQMPKYCSLNMLLLIVIKSVTRNSCRIWQSLLYL